MAALQEGFPPLYCGTRFNGEVRNNEQFSGNYSESAIVGGVRNNEKFIFGDRNKKK